MEGKSMNALFGLFAVLLSLGSAGQAIASESTELDDIRRELAALVSRVAALEAEAEAQVGAPVVVDQHGGIVGATGATGVESGLGRGARIRGAALTSLPIYLSP